MFKQRSYLFISDITHTLYTTNNLQHYSFIKKQITKKNTTFFVITPKHYKASQNSDIPYILKLTGTHVQIYMFFKHSIYRIRYFSGYVSHQRQTNKYRGLYTNSGSYREQLFSTSQ